MCFVFSCVIFAREILNDHIHCIQDGSDAIGAKISEPAFDSYCYISDTFTLPKVFTNNHDLSNVYQGKACQISEMKIVS